MAPKHHLRWLYAELPTLVSKEVLSTEDAARVQAYYGAPATRGRSSLGIVICSIPGGLLIGAGIILLFAHNWQQLSRPVRTVLALLPLVIAQGLAGWTIVRRPVSAAWREGASAFLLTMIGASHVAPAAERAYRRHVRRQKREAYITVRVRAGKAVLEELYIAGLPILEFVNKDVAQRK